MHRVCTFIGRLPMASKLAGPASVTSTWASSLPSVLGSVPIRSAGHSKWAKIQRQKGANDAARSMVFSKMSAAISAAARAGGPDPVFNLRLFSAIEKARSMNTPKDIIERAVASAAAASANVDEVSFEGLGPGNVAVLVETLTNNKKRTTLGLRTIFKHYGCEIGTNGSVSFMFESRGRLTVPLADEEAATQDALLSAAMDAEAHDVEFLEGDDAAGALATAGLGAAAPKPASAAYVWTDAGRAHSVRKALDGSAFKPLATEVIRFPTTTIEVTEDAEAALGDFIAALEDHEDVQVVYHNAV